MKNVNLTFEAVQEPLVRSSVDKLINAGQDSGNKNTRGIMSNETMIYDSHIKIENE